MVEVDKSWGDHPMNAEPTRLRREGPVPTKSQLAYEFIRSRILSGAYTPGFRLVLGRLSEEVGASIAPIREAIRRLELEQLVAIEPNVGAYVRRPVGYELESAIESLAVVEAYATALSAPLITAADLDRARTINNRMRESLQDFDPHAFRQSNVEFHGILYGRCPNSHLVGLVEDGWRTVSGFPFFVPGRAPATVDEHDRLLELIEQRPDARAVECAAREHNLAALVALRQYSYAD